MVPLRPTARQRAAAAFRAREGELAAALAARGTSDPRAWPNHTRSDLWRSALDARIIGPHEYEWARVYVGEDLWWYAGD